MSHNIVFLIRHPQLFVVLILTFLCLSVQGQVLITEDSVTSVASKALLELRSSSKTLLLTNLSSFELINPGWERGQITMVTEPVSLNGVTNNLYYFSQAPESLFSWSKILTASNNQLALARDVRTNSMNFAEVNSYYLGWNSGNSNIGASFNTSLGYSSINTVITGSHNTAIGAHSMQRIASGTYNSAVGYAAGEFYRGGQYNSALGAFAGTPGAPDDTLSYTTAIGYNARPQESHQIMMGTELETVHFPNKVNFAGKDSLIDGSEGGRGDVYVHTDGGNSRLYFKETDSTWTQLNPEPLRYEVGDIAYGGVVFYVDTTGQHGLVCSLTDLTDSTKWEITGAPDAPCYARSNGIYAGYANTSIIVSFYSAFSAASNLLPGNPSSIFGPSNDYAACYALAYTTTVDGTLFGGWYLPSQEELLKIYEVKDIIEPTMIAVGGSAFGIKAYWSSQENDDGTAFAVFLSGNLEVLTSSKNLDWAVRAVRKF